MLKASITILGGDPETADMKATKRWKHHVRFVGDLREVCYPQQSGEVPYQTQTPRGTIIMKWHREVVSPAKEYDGEILRPKPQQI